MTEVCPILNSGNASTIAAKLHLRAGLAQKLLNWETVLMDGEDAMWFRWVFGKSVSIEADGNGGYLAKYLGKAKDSIDAAFDFIKCDKGDVAIVRCRQYTREEFREAIKGETEK